MLEGREMTDLFFGCQYVSGKVKLPNGALVDKKRFNVIYGGHEFDLGCGHKTRSAWQAFIHHNVHGRQVVGPGFCNTQAVDVQRVGAVAG